MNTFSALIEGDARKGVNWFKDNTATKIFVAMGFVAVIICIVIAELKIGSIYLSFATDYAPFGPAMAVYSLKAAVFILFVFAVISSTTMSSSTLYQNSNLLHLFTLPIKPISVFVSKILPAWLTSVLVLLLLFPLFYVYNKYIFKSGTFLVITSLGLLALSIVSQALGTIFSTLIAYFFGKISKQKQFLIFVSILIAFVFFAKILFPSGMFRLADASDYSTFQSQLNKFPLMGRILPTNWLVDALSGNIDILSIGSTLVATFCLIVIVRIIGYQYYLSSWRRAQSQSYLAGSSGIMGKFSSNFPKIGTSKNVYLPLIINDILSLTRSGTEINYSLFLGGLLIILILSINNLTTLKDTTPSLLLAVYLIAFVSVTLIFLISAIRLIFPMIAKEKLTSWFSFSLPISRVIFLREKILVALLLAIPGIFAAIVTAISLRLPSEKTLVLISVMSATTLFINVLQCLFGSINPNFRESQNPDAVSTSSMGMLAFMLSLLFIVLSTFFVSGYFHGVLTIQGLASRWLITAVVILLPVIFKSVKSIKKYSM